jgi:hypothetical protein
VTPPMPPWTCRFGWHNWSLWQVIERGENGLKSVVGDEYVRKGLYLIQERTCTVCGKHQLGEANS